MFDIALRGRVCNEKVAMSPRAHSSRRYLEPAAWLIVAVILAYKLAPILSVKEVAGWDLPMHRAWCELMVQFLTVGRFSGYDPVQLGGIPAFVLYPPLFYILVALPTVVTAGALPTTLAFNIVLVLIPFLFIFATRTAAVRIYGTDAAPWAVESRPFRGCTDAFIAPTNSRPHPS